MATAVGNLDNEIMDQLVTRGLVIERMDEFFLGEYEYALNASQARLSISMRLNNPKLNLSVPVHFTDLEKLSKLELVCKLFADGWCHVEACGPHALTCADIPKTKSDN